MDFWPSLAVEIIGGLFTAAALAVGATAFAAWRGYLSHDASLLDLRDDTRRWLQDRDRDLRVQTSAAITQMAVRGLLHAGGFLVALADFKRQALKEYRDEISRKRTIYRGLLDSETWAHRRFRGKPLDRYELTDDDRAILEAWRAPATYEGHADESAPVDDPTSEDREPDLRRFGARVTRRSPHRGLHAGGCCRA